MRELEEGVECDEIEQTFGGRSRKAR